MMPRNEESFSGRTLPEKCPGELSRRIPLPTDPLPSPGDSLSTVDFFSFLRSRLAASLPGIDAHREFVPALPDAESRLRGAPPGARASAVLVPLIPRTQAFPDVLLEVRSESLRTHKGQISFPGGRLDDGENPEDAALRELEEEVGITAENVIILGTLTPLYIPPSNSAVYPVVGMVRSDDAYISSAAEVAEVFSVSLSTLLNPSSVRFEPRTLFGHVVDVPFFDVHDRVPLWGATAMILNELVWIGREYVSSQPAIITQS